MPASFRLRGGGGEALQSQDERLTLLHLVPSPSGLQPTQSLSPDPQSSEGAGWGCGGGRAAHKCTDSPWFWAVWSQTWLSQQELVLSGSHFAQLPQTGQASCAWWGWCGPVTDGLRPGEEVPEVWGNAPPTPIPVLHYGLGPCSFPVSSAKTSSTWCEALWGLGHPSWETVHTGWPGEGPFPQKSGLLDGTVTLRAEAVTVSGPVSADHLPGSVSSLL